MSALHFLGRYVFALLSLPFLFTVGIFSARHRDLIWKMSEQFGWKPAGRKNPRPPMNIAKVSVAEVLSPEGFALLAPGAENGNVTLTELMVINSLVKNARPARLFEIGTFDGRTALNMIANAPDEARLWTLDLPASQLEDAALPMLESEKKYVRKAASGARFQGHPLGARIEQLLGDSGRYDFTPYAGQIDVMFVDGSHAYEYVMHDTQTALAATQKDGLIIWHDYGNWRGVTLALNEFFERRGEFAGLRHVEGTSVVYLWRGKGQ